MPSLWCVITGLFGGFASGLLGVGGGVIFVPLFILLGRIDSHLAVGTSLAIVVPTAIMGAWNHSRAGMIDWKIVFIVMIFAVIGAWLGSTLSLRLDTVVLKRIFGVLLMGLAVKMFFPGS